jgi:hypothetical protein
MISPGDVQPAHVQWLFADPTALTQNAQNPQKNAEDTLLGR